MRITSGGMRALLGLGSTIGVGRAATSIGGRFMRGAPAQITRGRSASPALWSGDARSAARAAMGSGKRFRGRSPGVHALVSTPSAYEANLATYTGMTMRDVEKIAGQHLQRRTGAMEHILGRARNDAERQALGVAHGTISSEFSALADALRKFADKATAHPVKKRLEANAARLREVEANYQGMKSLGAGWGIA